GRQGRRFDVPPARPGAVPGVDRRVRAERPVGAERDRRGAVPMTRLFFYVEGQTEQGYVTKVLTPHLANFGVYVAGAILAASGRRHGKTFRGGGDSYLKMRRDLAARLKEHAQPDVRFTTMFDLYALYNGWPGWDKA